MQSFEILSSSRNFLATFKASSDPWLNFSMREKESNGISFSSNEYACRDEYRSNSKLYRITFGDYGGLPCGLRNANDLTSSNISLGGNSSNLFCI